MIAPASIAKTTAPKCSSSTWGIEVNSQYSRRPASAISPHPRPQRIPAATGRSANARRVRNADAARIGAAASTDVRKQAMPYRHSDHD